MSARTRHLVAAAGTVAALALSGCLPGGDTDDAAASGDMTTGSGRPLDLGEIRAAAPDEEEIGDGWRTDPESIPQQRLTARDFTPQVCMQIDRIGPGDDEGRQRERGEAKVGYSRASNGAVSQSLTVSISSYDAPVPTSWFDGAGEALSKCSRYEHRNTYGTPLEYEARALTFPQLGDRTSAFRIIHHSLNGPSLVYTWDVVTVAVGHNLVQITHLSEKGPPDAETTERTVRAALAGLEEQG